MEMCDTGIIGSRSGFDFSFGSLCLYHNFFWVNLCLSFLVPVIVRDYIQTPLGRTFNFFAA